MDNEVLKAALAAGIRDVGLLKLLPASDAPATERVAAFRQAKPHLFDDTAARAAINSITSAEYARARSAMLQQGARDDITRRNTREAAAISTRYAAQDDAKARRIAENAARQAEEDRRFAERRKSRGR
jgi:hypothetical protein